MPHPQPAETLLPEVASFVAETGLFTAPIDAEWSIRMEYEQPTYPPGYSGKRMPTVRVVARTRRITAPLFQLSPETGKMDLAPVHFRERVPKHIRHDIWRMLQRIEADPINFAATSGIETGVCCCCGRELTDPESVARGIGPICFGRATGWKKKRELPHFDFATMLKEHSND